MKTMRNNFRYRHKNRIWIRLLAAAVGFYVLMCLYANVSDNDTSDRLNYGVWQFAGKAVGSDELG